MKPRPDAPTGRIAAIWSDSFGRVALRCLQVLIVLALAGVVVWAGLQVKTVVISVLIALILASAFSPLSGLLRRLHLPAALAALVTLVVAIGVLVGVLTLVVLAVVNQWSSLVDAAGDGVDRLNSLLKDFGLSLSGSEAQSALSDAGDYLTSASFGSTALSGLSTAGNIGTGLFLVIVVVFFFLKDGRRIADFLERPLHGQARARAERVGRAAVDVLGAYARGTALVALVDAVFIGLGLVILQVTLAIPLAVFVFVTAFIPVVGATLAGIVAALVALVTGGPITALIVVGIVILVNQLEGNLLQPLIMGRSLSLHPLVILLALTAGTILGGIVGAVLAVPTASVVWTGIKAWNPPREDGDGDGHSSA